jgi:hypothetical protein
MKNKTIFIGLGVLAVAGIGYYMWKKKSETTSGACGCSGADGEEKSNISAPSGSAGDGMKWCCYSFDVNGSCVGWEARSSKFRCMGETYGSKV